LSSWFNFWPFLLIFQRVIKTCVFFVLISIASVTSVKSAPKNSFAQKTECFGDFWKQNSLWLKLFSALFTTGKCRLLKSVFYILFEEKTFHLIRDYKKEDKAQHFWNRFSFNSVRQIISEVLSKTPSANGQRYHIPTTVKKGLIHYNLCCSFYENIYNSYHFFQMNCYR